MIRNEKLLKGCFKRKISITMGILVGFLIMGSVSMGANPENYYQDQIEDIINKETFNNSDYNELSTLIGELRNQNPELATKIERVLYPNGWPDQPQTAGLSEDELRRIQEELKEILEEELGEEVLSGLMNNIDLLQNLHLLGFANWINQTTLRQRLGNLRNRTEGNGVWARIKGGKSSYNEVNSEYEFVQVGWDRRYVDYNIGGAFSYSKGDVDFNNKGDGEIEDYTFSLYATKLYESGCYMDYVVKVGNIDTEFDLPMGTNLASGDYSNTAMALSFEGGKEVTLNDKWYIKPYGKFTLAHAKGDDFKIDNEEIGVEQEDITNFNGRLGIELVRRLENNGELYAKVEVAKDLSGESEMDIVDLTTGDKTNYKKEMEEAWTEIAIGFDKKLEEDFSIYGEINKSFGGDYEKDWEAQIGFKYKF